ncbi:MAG TPA: hypothetical protein DEB74_12840 [Lachnospiraceae bacterium]|nr:hypothetical protein [Lachnospiraceae bacterium]
MHRIAFARIVKRVASFCMDWAFAQTDSIQIGIYKNNVPMQNMLWKNSFCYFEKIYLKSGESRIAFQKTADIKQI